MARTDCCFSLEIVLILLSIFYVAGFSGLDILRSEARETCCPDTPPTLAPNSTANNTDVVECSVIENMVEQSAVFTASYCLIILTYMMTMAFLIRENELPNYPRFAMKIWKCFGFLSRPRALCIPALLAQWMCGLYMGVALSLSRMDCIRDGPVWDTYVQYMGLGIFNMTFATCYLALMMIRAWETSRRVRVLTERQRGTDTIVLSGGSESIGGLIDAGRRRSAPRSSSQKKGVKWWPLSEHTGAGSDEEVDIVPDRTIDAEFSELSERKVFVQNE